MAFVCMSCGGRGNEIGDEGAKAVGDAVPGLSSLEMLGLG
jgi:hypothetical protein